MIIIGYQGIGKSTLAEKSNDYIDLESSNFFVDGHRPDDWYKTYCQIAEHLSQQGYVVFTSSHEVVRNQLLNSKETIAICYPSLYLEDAWIKKLETRWLETKSEKNYKALMNAKCRFKENIQELINYNNYTLHLIINDMDYNLEETVNFARKDENV